MLLSKNIGLPDGSVNEINWGYNPVDENTYQYCQASFKVGSLVGCKEFEHSCAITEAPFKRVLA